jgi:hypothetical protein
MGHNGFGANAPPPLLLEDEPYVIFNMTAPPDIHCEISTSRKGLSDEPALGVVHFLGNAISRSDPPFFLCGFAHGEFYIPGNLIGLSTNSDCETEQPLLHSV